MAEIFQQGHRAQLLAIAPQAWQLALDLLASDSAQKSVVARYCTAHQCLVAT